MKLHTLSASLILALNGLLGCDAPDPLVDDEGGWVDEIAQAHRADNSAGAVYTMTNDPTFNEVSIFLRAADGRLTPWGNVPTGGTGTGFAEGGLSNQNAIILDRGGSYLYVVNPASHNITVFRVRGAGLQYIQKVPSGGERPISLTRSGRWLYVLNSGGAGNITGFSVGNDGLLTPIAGSTQPVSGVASDPGQVGFDPKGRFLVVTEHATHRIITYRVNSDGRAGPPVFNQSAGPAPWGFAFDADGRLYVAEVSGYHPPNAGALSEYRINSDGTLAVLRASVKNMQTTPGWVVLTGDGKYGYTSNAFSHTITGYRTGPSDDLTLLDPTGVSASTGAASLPIDMARSRDSRYLYVLNWSARDIASFIIQPDGSLKELEHVGGLTFGSNGLAAR